MALGSVKPAEQNSIDVRPEGILVVDKPAGWTSHDIVAKVRKILGVKRVGHAGTLDPAATGVLPLCVGRATRIVEYLVDVPKAYRARLKLGEETDTEDATGRIVQRKQLGGLSDERIRSAVMAFQGDMLQIPPMYAAIKIDGRRLYEYARVGDEILREPRPIHVYKIKEVTVDQPFVNFHVRCSKGTYIRSLCRDMGRELGVGGHLNELRRTESASFTETDAHPMVRLIDMGRQRMISLLLPMDRPLAGFDAVTVCADQVRKVCHGQALDRRDLCRLPESWSDASLLRIYGEDGTFLAVGQAGISAEGQPRVYPRKVLYRQERD
jgi:tRNA pseudouridine55 synthase